MDVRRSEDAYAPIRVLAALWLTFTCWSAAGPSTVAAQEGPFLFTDQLSTPVGVTVSQDGTVWVASDATFNVVLTAFAPDGTPLGQLPFGDFSSIGAGTAMATDPATGLIWMLSSTGDVHLLDPSTGEVELIANLRQLAIDTSTIYDLASETYGSQGGTVVPSAADYGDLALLRRGDQLDVFITGNSVAIPFVMRLRIENDQLVSASGVATSLATAAGANNLPRGIAVNNEGVVLTALPFLGAVGSEMYDRAVAFSANFPDGEGFELQIVLDGDDFTSYGLDAHPDGYFVAAVGLGVRAGANRSRRWCSSRPSWMTRAVGVPGQGFLTTRRLWRSVRTARQPT